MFAANASIIAVLYAAIIGLNLRRNVGPRTDETA
jgi:hypothetical protein